MSGFVSDSQTFTCKRGMMFQSCSKFLPMDINSSKKGSEMKQPGHEKLKKKL